MHACWGGRKDVVLRFWYASNATTFEEYIQGQDGEWRRQLPWTGKSGAAGVGCFSWGSPIHKYIYAAFVNLDSQLEIWYQDRKATNPAQDWVKCK